MHALRVKQNLHVLTFRSGRGGGGPCLSQRRVVTPATAGSRRPSQPRGKGRLPRSLGDLAGVHLVQSRPQL